jgi:hypothetical protein
VALVAISATETVDALNAGTPYADNQAAERTITREVLAGLPPGPGEVVIDDSQGLGPTLGRVLALERRGIKASVVPSQRVLFGDHRDAGPGPYRAGLVVVSGAAVDTVKPTGPRIAHFERPWSAEERRRTRRDIVQTRALAPSEGRTVLLEELERRLDRPAQVISVYLVPAEQVMQGNTTG